MTSAILLSATVDATSSVTSATLLSATVDATSSVTSATLVSATVLATCSVELIILELSKLLLIEDDTSLKPSLTLGVEVLIESDKLFI